MNNEELYECALSNLTTEPGEYSESDGLDDLPVGWTKVQITRRQYNPEWVILQQLKENMLQQLLGNIPPNEVEVNMPYLRVQVDSVFHAKEKDTPMYLADVQDVVFLSDSKDIEDGVNELREMLGLEAVSSPDSDDDDAVDVSEESDKRE